MVFGGKILVVNQSTESGSRESVAPLRPLIVLIHDDETRNDSAGQQAAEEKCGLFSCPMNVSQGKSKENGNQVPKKGRDSRSLKIVGKNRRQKYAPEKQSTEKKKWPWNAKNTFF